MVNDSIVRLKGDVVQLLERAGRGRVVLQGEAAVERAWAIASLKVLQEHLDLGFVPPRILRGSDIMPSNVATPRRMNVDPRDMGPGWDDGFGPADPCLVASQTLFDQYMKLETSCRRCIDYLRVSAARCPYCRHCLERFQGRMLWKAFSSTSPDIGVSWAAGGGRAFVEIEVGGKVVTRATPRPGSAGKDLWTAPFSRDIVLIVRGPMQLEFEDARVLRVLAASEITLTGPEIDPALCPDIVSDGLPLVRLGRRDKYVDE